MRTASLIALALGVGGAPERGALAEQQVAMRGVVYDSVARRPLSGAVVQLVPVDPTLVDVGRRTTTSDSSGSFVLPEVGPGRYVVGFFHPRLDSLGIDAPVRRIEVRGGRSPVVELAVPSAESVVAAWCGPRATSDSTGVILGYARDARGNATWPEATVDARWRAITITLGGARTSVQEARARTSPRGWFALCGVPRGGLVVVQASVDGDSSAVLELDVPEDGVLRRDIAFVRRDAFDLPGLTLRGAVRDGSGAPVAGARVRWWGGLDEVRADQEGRFALPARPGTRLLDVRMVGFVPERRVVDIGADSVAGIDVTMAEFPMEIDTVRVLARRPRPAEALAGFERRRRLGHGVFLDTDAIELRRPLVFTDLLRSLPGIEVRSADMMTRLVRMRSTNGLDACEPVLVIDGMRLPMHDMNLDDVIPADLVRAVEVYPRRMQAPPEFQGETCGSLVVWTGLRGWIGKRLARPPGGP